MHNKAKKIDSKEDLYFPELIIARLVEKYQVGPYHCMVYDNCLANSAIIYQYVMLVHQGEDDVPCFACASEYPLVPGIDLNDLHFIFGIFPGPNHQHKGIYPDDDRYGNLEYFVKHALKVVCKHFHLPPKATKLKVEKENNIRKFPLTEEIDIRNIR